MSADVLVSLGPRAGTVTTTHMSGHKHTGSTCGGQVIEIELSINLLGMHKTRFGIQQRTSKMCFYKDILDCLDLFHKCWVESLVIIKLHNMLPNCILSTSTFQEIHYGNIWWNWNCLLCQIAWYNWLIWRSRLVVDNLSARNKSAPLSDCVLARLSLFTRFLKKKENAVNFLPNLHKRHPLTRP